MSTWPVVEVLAWCAVPLAAFLGACAGKSFFMPYRCTRFTCWRSQNSLYRLYLRQNARRYARGHYP